MSYSEESLDQNQDTLDTGCSVGWLGNTCLWKDVEQEAGTREDWVSLGRLFLLDMATQQKWMNDLWDCLQDGENFFDSL